ncbi:hypothetical protein OBBRIDRAFT_243424 [Obba rivulosa]|uniref:Uncharacterized protein n=1 Tax=Obba rivulosa TaxID=1052685 RepID=A0A8E2AKQ6_9APHY|nr:hypothetical protein OBBRIDRAFT_243424 [Obba rivulosa]
MRGVPDEIRQPTAGPSTQTGPKTAPSAKGLLATPLGPSIATRRLGVHRSYSDNALWPGPPKGRRGIPTLTTEHAAERDGDVVPPEGVDVLVDISHMIRRTSRRRSLHDYSRTRRDRPETASAPESPPTTQKDRGGFDVLDEIRTMLCLPSALEDVNRVKITA